MVVRGMFPYMVVRGMVLHSISCSREEQALLVAPPNCSRVTPSSTRSCCTWMVGAVSFIWLEGVQRCILQNEYKHTNKQTYKHPDQTAGRRTRCLVICLRVSVGATDTALFSVSLSYSTPHRTNLSNKVH